MTRTHAVAAANRLHELSVEAERLAHEVAEGLDQAGLRVTAAQLEHLTDDVEDAAAQLRAAAGLAVKALSAAA